MDQHAERAASALLFLAGDLMEEHGHMTEGFWQGSLGYQGGPMCTEGAVRVAFEQVYGVAAYTGCRDTFTLAMRALKREVVERGAPNVPGWNDYHCSGRDEAVQLLRDTATKLMPDEMHVGPEAA